MFEVEVHGRCIERFLVLEHHGPNRLLAPPPVQVLPTPLGCTQGVQRVHPGRVALETIRETAARTYRPMPDASGFSPRISRLHEMACRVLLVELQPVPDFFSSP
jgi:hypothetical protein